MRRDGPDCLYPTTEGAVARARLPWLEPLDPERVIAALEPLVTPARGERLRAVVAARLDSVTVVLDSPHDPHNGAAVVRSCDAFGVGRVHVLERHEHFVASTTVSRGAERWVDVRGYPTADGLAAALAASGHTLVATHPDGALAATDLGDVPRLALVLGNEHAGIGPDLAGHCASSVRVPMRGFVESLNLSVTAAVLLSHATVGRRGDLPPPVARRLYARFLATTVSRARDVLTELGIHAPTASGCAGGPQ